MLIIPPLTVSGDNQAVINQLNGTWQSTAYSSKLSSIQTELWMLSRDFHVTPYDYTFFHHVPRKYNRRADSLANRALDKGDESKWYRKGLQELFTLLAQSGTSIYVQARFDGAYRRKTKRSSIGVSIELAKSEGPPRPLFDLGVEVFCENSYEAELLAAARTIRECTQLYTKIYLGTFP